jgi:hypothetical protein
VDVGFRFVLHGTALLVQGRLPDPDTERMGHVDGVLTVAQREALSVAEVGVLVVFFIILCSRVAVILVGAHCLLA